MSASARGGPSRVPPIPKWWRECGLAGQSVMTPSRPNAGQDFGVTATLAHHTFQAGFSLQEAHGGAVPGCRGALPRVISSPILALGGHCPSGLVDDEVGGRVAHHRERDAGIGLGHGEGVIPEGLEELYALPWSGHGKLLSRD